MTESNIDLKWEIEKIKVVLLAVFDTEVEEDLTRECYKLYSAHIENYNEVVIFFFRTGELLDSFVELFLGKNKCEEDALYESGCYAKFIGSTLIFKEDIEDIETDKLSQPISITQRIGIDDCKLKNYSESQIF